MSFSTALDHAIHIRRLYQHLLDEMKCFEAAWRLKDTEEYYKKNYFLQDMHQTLIYLREVMDFRNAPIDAPFQDTELMNTTLNKTASRPQYTPTLPVTKPFLVPSEPTNQVPKPNLENTTAGPSHVNVASEVNASVDTVRHRSSKGKQRETQSDEAPVHSEVDDRTGIARHRSPMGKEREAQLGEPVQAEVDDSTSTTRNRSSKGKEREARLDEIPVQNDDRVVPTTNTEESTKVAVAPGTASDSGLVLVRQPFGRNYTTVGTITADTPRYQAPPNHPPVPRGGTYRLNHNARRNLAPVTHEVPHQGSSRHRDELCGSPGPETTGARQQESSHHHRTRSRSNLVPSSSHRRNPSRPVAMTRNEVDEGLRPPTGKRRRDEVEEDADRRTRSQKRSRRD